MSALKMLESREQCGLIPVVVVRPFSDEGVPCPQVGAYGEVYDFDGSYACVRFRLPLVDTKGDELKFYGEDRRFLRLRMTLDEIEVCQPGKTHRNCG